MALNHMEERWGHDVTNDGETNCPFRPGGARKAALGMLLLYCTSINKLLIKLSTLLTYQKDWPQQHQFSYWRLILMDNISILWIITNRKHHSTTINLCLYPIIYLSLISTVIVLWELSMLTLVLYVLIMHYYTCKVLFRCIIHALSYVLGTW